MPTVSCVMPTTLAREKFVPLAARWWLAQTFPEAERELVVLVDGEGSGRLAALLPQHPRVRLVQLAAGAWSLGAKMNAAVDEARGEYIAVWEDDDWHGPRRLERQMAALLESGAAKCGTRSMLFADLVHGGAMWRLTMPATPHVGIVAHGSIVAHRSVFARTQYPDRSDGDYRWQAVSATPAVELDADEWYIGTRHGGNTWAFDDQQVKPGLWERVDATLAVMAPAVAAAYRRALA